MLLTVLFTGALIFNAGILTLTLNRLRGQGMETLFKEKDYSYIGADFPAEFASGDIPYIPLSIEELPFNLDQSSQSPLPDWSRARTVESGFVRLGPRFRILSTVLGHELHCLRTIIEPAMDVTLPKDELLAMQHHVRHCLNFLRQAILCDSSLYLEPKIPSNYNFSEHHMGPVHPARDWRLVLSKLNENHEAWIEQRKQLERHQSET
ncbi:hypothetical protein SCHPADRAFT_946728 [Schizopora paradoxa]|uniref:Uncharacterized protein n=1 Tax=Schizopora paradoxa TaxID=27342 RepID=A0A0H2R817_9AGAM|nr:hypothetical protein SCHPADRAFT_946728 [Schizopora paradoxa]